MAQLMTEDERNFYKSQIDLAKEQKRLAEEQKKFIMKQEGFIQKQKEFIDLQKKDLFENKKDRKSIKQFTFILAFGVIVTIFFNLFQIILQFKQANSSHILIMSGIFILLFVFFVQFIFHIFPMRKEMVSFAKTHWMAILILIFFIIIFLIFWFITPDIPLS